MQEHATISDPRYSGGIEVKKVKKVFDNGEKFFEIDGEKLALKEVETTYYDGNLINCLIVLQQIITPESIEVIVNL